MSNSYPPTTLVPPSPSRISAQAFPLPDDDQELCIYYTYIRNYLDRLWESYIVYCRLVSTPEATKIFKIIFAEMDYFEIILGRIVDSMSKSFRMQVRHDYVI
jgi:hypothetical protein